VDFIKIPGLAEATRPLNDRGSMGESALSILPSITGRLARLQQEKVCANLTPSELFSFFLFFFGKSEGKRLIDYKDLRTVKQLADEAPFVTESKIRWWIFHAESNGFDAAMIKIGGRVYIDKAAFNKWLEGHRVAA